MDEEDPVFNSSRACLNHEDPDLFYRPADIEQAKQVCRRCPVAAACRSLALATGEEHGVWGGLGSVERLEMLQVPARGTRRGSRGARQRAVA